MHLRSVPLLLLGVVAGRASAQQSVDPASELAAYVRLLELEGTASGTPLVFSSSSLAPRAMGLRADSGHLWSGAYPLRPAVRNSSPELVLLDPGVELFYNTTFPRTANDGSVWAGKGFSARIRGGLHASWRGVSARLEPSFVYAQNLGYTLGTGPESFRSIYVYPWHRIDLPQRFGGGSVKFLDLGQSGIRFDTGALTFGFSTENLWWGPGSRNAIVMSNTAPGVPHVDVGTGRPVGTVIGDFEVRAIWGALSRSQYFGPSQSDGRRVLTGITAGYRPSFLPGLTVGATRALYHQWPAGGLTADDLLDVFGVLFNPGRRQPDGTILNDTRDQLLSLVARWVLAPVRFEAYVEWARNDFAGSLTDLLLEPDHSQAITVGFQKVLPSGGNRLVLKGEITDLSGNPTFLLRDEPVYYVHHLAVEGYTHRGQLLGAAIGPGSNAQYLGIDRYTSNGRYGVFLERVRYDDDYVFRSMRGVPFAYLRHQVGLTIGLSVLRFVGAYHIGGGLEFTRDLNRYFQSGNDLTNLKLSFSLKRRMH